MDCSSSFRHSPFRQQKTKDKHEIDKLTLTMVCTEISWLLLSYNVPLALQYSSLKILYTARAWSYQPIATIFEAVFAVCLKYKRCRIVGLEWFVSNPFPSLFQDVKFPDEFSDVMKSLLGGLLQRNVPKRLGCQGKG